MTEAEIQAVAVAISEAIEEAKEVVNRQEYSNLYRATDVSRDSRVARERAEALLRNLRRLGFDLVPA